MFWMTVVVAYAVIISVGLTVGLYLAGRFPKKGGGTPTPDPAPLPEGPCHWCALGNDFDRDLIPGIAWEHVHEPVDA